MIKICIYCDKEFQYNSKMSRKKYCSIECVNNDTNFITNRTKKIKDTYQQRTITNNKCVWCDNFLDSRRVKYCSKKCKSEEANSRLKAITRENTKIKARKIKTELISKKGGGCKLCGYNKNIKALSFHHLNDKKFELTQTNIIKFNKKTIIDEANKCVVLCLNCHQEIHDTNINIDYDTNIEYIDIPDDIFVNTRTNIDTVYIYKTRNKIHIK